MVIINDREIEIRLGDRVIGTIDFDIRVDYKTKERGTKTLAAMGMWVSDATRMLLVRVVAEKALPFDVTLPNATTANAMCAADKGHGKRQNSAHALFEYRGI